MTTIEHLVNTSATDCRITLHNQLQSDPLWVAATSLDLLKRLQGQPNQATRRRIAAGSLRSACRAIAEMTELDARGPRSNDDYYTISTEELRAWIDTRIQRDPAEAATEMLATLIAIRGEIDCQTRRQMLRAGIGRAVRAMEDSGQEVVA